eukprot:gene13969-19911_t
MRARLLVPDVTRALCFSTPAIPSTSASACLIDADQLRSFGSTVKRAQAFKAKPTDKNKKKTDDDSKVNPKQQLIMDMLEASPEAGKGKEMTSSQLALNMAEAKGHIQQYLQFKIKEEDEWKQDIGTKFELQKAALAALPKALKEKAMMPDLTPYPPNRKIMFDSAPAAYGTPDKETTPEDKATYGTPDEETAPEAKASAAKMK